MRSSMRSGLVVIESPPPSSTSRQRRSGATGSSALQCGSGRAASARLNVGYVFRGSPLAAAQCAGEFRVKLDARAKQQHVALERRERKGRARCSSAVSAPHASF